MHLQKLSLQPVKNLLLLRHLHRQLIQLLSILYQPWLHVKPQLKPQLKKRLRQLKKKLLQNHKTLKLSKQLLILPQNLRNLQCTRRSKKQLISKRRWKLSCLLFLVNVSTFNQTPEMVSFWRPPLLTNMLQKRQAFTPRNWLLSPQTRKAKKLSNGSTMLKSKQSTR